MGRLQKITAAEVLELLEKKDAVTISELSDIFSVAPETVRSRIRQLREDGEIIIHNSNGLFLLDKQTIETDEDMAESFRLWIFWILKIFRGLMIAAKPAQPLLPSLRRSLRESLDAEERKMLGHSCVKVKALLDYAQAEEEDETE